MPDTALETRGLTKAFGGFRAVRGLDLKIRRHAIEFGNHRFDLHDAAALLVDLKLLQANERLTRLHQQALPPSPHGPYRPQSKGGSTATERILEVTPLVFGFQARKDAFQPGITLVEAGTFVFSLVEEGFQRLVKRDCLVYFRARPAPVRA